jgi:hypothetical protein
VIKLAALALRSYRSPIQMMMVLALLWLKQAQTILGAYWSSTAATVVILGVLAAGMFTAHFETTPIGITLVLFEWLGAMLGIYAGVSLRRQLVSYFSDIVPGYKQKHVIAAISLTAVVAAACIAGTAFAGAGEMWDRASTLRMFVLLWGWSLVWFYVGHEFTMIAYFFPMAMHLSLMPALAVRVEPYLWSLIENSSSTQDFLLAAAVSGFAVLLAFFVARPEREPSERAPSGIWKWLADGVSAKAFDRIPRTVGPGLRSRIRHLEFGLKPDHWVFALMMLVVYTLWGRYRWGNKGDALTQGVYVWCFMGCSFMLGQDVFTRARLRSLLQLPLKRHDLIRGYGLTLFLSCARRWCALVLVAWGALIVPVPGLAPTSLPGYVWGYCIGILLIVFSLRALAGSWNDHLLFPVGAIVLFLLLEIPASPAVAILIGLGLFVAAYYRWCSVELD